jgi:hypothetical protein
MAGYGNISATSFMVWQDSESGRNSITEEDKQILIDKTSYIGDTDNKIYIPVYLRNYRVVGCVDSGSDLTIMHLSIYMKIFRDLSALSPSPIQSAR